MKRSGVLLVLLGLVASIAGVPAVARGRSPAVVPGNGTRAPARVASLPRVALDLPPIAAARAHLASHRGVYRIDPRNELSHLESIADRDSVTVRFGQRHRGVEVFGAQYLVHLDRERDGLVADSANGHFFTRVDVPVTPRLDAAAARRLALLWSRPLVAARVERHGLTILPLGRGVLTYRFTLWGSRFGRPAKQEVFVNATTGRPVLAYDDLQDDGAVSTSGENVHGDTVPIEAFQRGDAYELRDRSREMFRPGSGEGQITTHNARQTPDYFGTARNIVTSSSAVFRRGATTSGAVDAHWGAGRVYEFYRALGRDSLDDRGSTIVSTVNAADPTTYEPMFNAFWDGTQMVYGNPGPIYPLSADLDVVGHELSHGVIDHSANLVYLHQAGAMNEAFADYFGNAIDNEASGIGMDDPAAGHLGEDLCRPENPSPRDWECPLRDLNDGMTTDDYVYYLADFDNGGVHLNATIFGGALWDVREALDPELADRIVYRALTWFVTPLDDFLDGRAAVVAAARDLGATEEQVDAIEAAFDAKGIVEGWETAAGSDAQVLVDDVAPVGLLFSPPQVSATRYVLADYRNQEDMCCEPIELYVGNVDGSGRLQKVGEDASRETFSDETPDISGRTVVWAHGIQTFGGLDFDVHARTLGGRVRTIAAGPGIQLYPSIDGKTVVWEDSRRRSTDIWFKRGSRRPRVLHRAAGEQWQPQVAGDWVVWWDVGDGSLLEPASIGMKNVRTGRRVTIEPLSRRSFVGPPTVGPGFVTWYEDRDGDGVGAIYKARLGRTKRTVLVGDRSDAAPTWEFGAYALNPPIPSANRRWVAYNDELGYVRFFAQQDPGFPASEVGRDIWIVSARGGRPRRITTNRGDQAYPLLARGRRVVWLDSAQGHTDLVTRVP
ncbi:MAG TPA: M4 family metallopeptidase [Actinomycetota bacterium]|nr:M4 family metallopeptidase [Actinomycetota bacterium]